MKKLSPGYPWLAPAIDKPEPRLLTSSDPESGEVPAIAHRELAFVDPGIEGCERLLEDLASGAPAGRSLDVVLLDPERDGIAQIAETLTRYQGLDAVHIVSHGGEGSVQLGNVWLSSGTLDLYADGLASWGNALGSKADLLFYGCELAVGTCGTAFVDSIAELTGADVAASFELTGSALLGGDRDSEATTGDIENEAPTATDAPGDFHTLIRSLNPTGHWAFGEPSGTNAIDSGSTGNDGTYYGATLGSPGAIDSNTAVAFDGSDDYVEISHDARYRLDDGTVQLWFNANDTQNGHLFSKDSMGFDTGGHLSIYLNPSEHVEVCLQSDSADYFVESTSSQPITAGQWHHVAFSFGSDGMMLYVDGALADTNAYTGGLGATSGGIGNLEPIAIGASTQISGNLTVTPLEDYFDGSIDEVALFDQALTAQTIQRLYDAATPTCSVVEDSTPSAVSVTGPSNAALFTPSPDDFFSYTPDSDFEGADTFTYRANDGGDGSNTGATDGRNESNTATASIPVTGVNEAPVVNDQTFSVDENSPNETPVDIVVATDVDASQSLTYSIIGGTGQTAFTINSGTGAITVADSAQLDFESTPSFTLTVQVQDGGTRLLTDTATITINLNKLNEAPVADRTQLDFESPPSFTHTVQVQHDGAEVGNLSAVEPDANDTCTNEIVGGDTSNAFAFDDNGSITVADRSQLEFDAQSAYDPTVQVTDSDSGTYPGTDPEPGDDPEQDPEPSEVDPGTRGGAIVCEDPNVEIEQADFTDRGQITLTSSQRTLFGGERMAKALDRIRMELTDPAHETADERQIVVSAAEGAMLAVSLSWLALLLRGESLAAVAFGGLPLWRRVDPPAVPALSGEERLRLEAHRGKDVPPGSGNAAA